MIAHFPLAIIAALALLVTILHRRTTQVRPADVDVMDAKRDYRGGANASSAPDVTHAPKGETPPRNAAPPRHFHVLRALGVECSVKNGEVENGRRRSND